MLAFQRFHQFIRQHMPRDPGTQYRISAQHIFDTRDLFHFTDHVLGVLYCHGGIREHHVGGADGKVFLQPVIGDDVRNVIRQAGAQVIINGIVGFPVAEQRREQQNGKDHQRPCEMLRHAPGQPGGIRDERAVLCFLQYPVKHQDQGRQGGDAAHHAQQDAFCHDDAQILAQRKAHEAQGDETGHGGDRAAHHGGQGGVDCF